jgi:hypothetical protein
MTAVTEFVILLNRDDDVYKASCTLGLYHLEASGRSRAQALRGMARVINRHLHRHQRPRPDEKKAELRKLPVPPTSASADGN